MSEDGEARVSGAPGDGGPPDGTAAPAEPPPNEPEAPDSGEPAADQPRAFEALLDFLRRTRAIDLTGYKRASLQRRILKRMQAVQLDDYAAYQRLLGEHPEEFARLFDTVLINVTSFFRDNVPWDFLASDIIPRIVARKRQDEPIRVWSAGCATGEEAYSLAIIFAEAVGLDAFREQVKIYATDLDEEALNQARHGSYSAKAVEGVPPALLDKYFEFTDGRYSFRKDLRRCMIFGRNDLVQDAPISRIDLLVCRNTLMYFDAATQAKVLSRFHFALAEGGYLFLGRAETLYTHAESFTPVDLKRRIFMKVSRHPTRERQHAPAPAGTIVYASRDALSRLRELAFESGAVAQVVVDRAGALVMANERARALFDLTAGDVGRPLQDLQMSYRPVELRSHIDHAYADRRPVSLHDVQWPAGSGKERWVDVYVLPIVDVRAGVLGVSITFTDTTHYKLLQRQLEHSHQELETAYEELQSTNEELETMNEEMQSTNEELQAINDELRQRSDELNQLNDFLEAVFASLRSGVAVIDRDLLLLVWNDKAEDLWGVRGDEVKGTHLLNLDIGLPVDMLKAPIRACLAGESDYMEVLLPATNRRGKSIGCRVAISPLRNVADETPRGAILLMDEVA
ncbi:MAG TPA: CheR family methyltransferase, partial [Gemmatimonadaceae bacterium]|nr:CheR family methyltransferase [Gemmatimonadaceae bacterium]